MSVSLRLRPFNKQACKILIYCPCCEIIAVAVAVAVIAAVAVVVAVAVAVAVAVCIAVNKQ